MDRVKGIWYLSPIRAAKVQASLRIRAVSPEPSLLAHTSTESRGTFRQKASSLAPLNGWACAVKICHDGMLEDTNSLDAAHMVKCFSGQHFLHLIVYVIVTKWIKSCLLQCFGTFKMPILMFISILVFRPEGQIGNPVRRDTRIYVRRILNAFRINKTQGI